MEDFGIAVTFTVRQHTGNEPCRIKIRNTFIILHGTIINRISMSMSKLIIVPTEIRVVLNPYTISKLFILTSLKIKIIKLWFVFYFILNYLRWNPVLYYFFKGLLKDIIEQVAL